jgi:hypothetical protein
LGEDAEDVSLSVINFNLRLIRSITPQL